MSCTPTTLASRYSGAMLSQSGDGFEMQINDISEIILNQSDPSVRFDLEQLKSVTSVFNRVLRYTDLTDYPVIDNRLNTRTQSDFTSFGLSYFEVADFLTQTSLNIDLVQYELVEFDNTQTYRANYPNLLITNLTAPYRDILNQYEGYLSDNANANASSGFCSTISNAFGQVMQIVSGIQVGTKLIDSLLGDLQNFSESNLQQLINNFVGDVISQLNTLQQKLVETIDNLVNTFIKQLDGVIVSITTLLNDLSNLRIHVANKLQAQFQNVREFFSDFTVENVKKSIYDFINKATSQFEELTPENIGLLLFRFCQFSEFLQSFFKSPLNTLKQYQSNIVLQREVLFAVSSENTKRVVNFGGFRLQDTEIDNARERMRERVNGVAESVPAGEAFNYIPNTKLTVQERQFSIDPSADGLPGIIQWAPSVIQMGKSVTDAGDDAGFKRVSFEILEKAIMAAKRVGKQIIINSAFRSREYNDRLRDSGSGVARNSLHTTGKALDISMDGFTDDDIKRFISALSSEGVGGLKYYEDSNFIHVDTGQVRTWGNNGRFSRSVAMHLNGEYRSGPQYPSSNSVNGF